MRGARKMIWKQFGLTLCGFIFGAMLLTIGGCNEPDDSADMARRLAEMGAGSSQAPAPAPGAQRQVPTPAQNPAGEDPEGEQEYAGPVVVVTDFSVKLPYDGFEGARRFDIVCSVQSEEAVDSQATWEIVAFNTEGDIVGTQKQHLAIPEGYSKPLDINSFYCTAVPTKLEFYLTGESAIPIDESGAGGDGGGSGGSSSSRGISN